MASAEPATPAGPARELQVVRAVATAHDPDIDGPPSARVRQARSAMLIGAAGFATYLCNVSMLSACGLHFDLRRAGTILLVAIVVDLACAATAGRWADRAFPVYLVEAVHAVLLTLVLPALGGIGMGFFYVAYAFTIFHTEMVRSDASLFVTANLCALCWAGLALAELAGVGGWLAPQPLVELTLAPDPGVYRAFVAANFVILNLLVFFSRGYGHQLRYLAERLRGTVAQRTAELTRANAELAEQARALEAKQEELRTFVYTVTHELKNPVNAALLTVDMVLERERELISARSRNELERVVRLAERVERMILDLLGLFKIVSTSEPVRRVELGALVDDALEELGAWIEAKGVRVRVGTLPDVVGQPGKLGHLVRNLLGNAVKYAPPEGGVVEVSGGVDGGTRVFRVRDDGPGIPERYHRQIFNLFWRVPEDPPPLDAQRPAGSGVGLTIVKRVVEAHGGTIAVDSRPGAGACFTVRLPGEAER